MSNKKLLPFNSIVDLITKFDKIRQVHEFVNSLYKQHLLDNHIQFIEIGKVGVMIDMSKVPKGKEQFIENPYKSMLDVVYEQVGVTDEINPKTITTNEPTN